MKGDLANDYKTIPIIYGETASKKIISTLILTIVPVYILVDVYDVGAMEIYFYLFNNFSILFSTLFMEIRT
jgi:4-hydroxybenzoate polyprenyltransferase